VDHLEPDLRQVARGARGGREEAGARLGGKISAKTKSPRTLLHAGLPSRTGKLRFNLVEGRFEDAASVESPLLALLTLSSQV
jgi:hypothetical protein